MQSLRERQQSLKELIKGIQRARSKLGKLKKEHHTYYGVWGWSLGKESGVYGEAEKLYGQKRLGKMEGLDFTDFGLPVVEYKKIEKKLRGQENKIRDLEAEFLKQKKSLLNRVAEIKETRRGQLMLNFTGQLSFKYQ